MALEIDTTFGGLDGDAAVWADQVVSEKNRIHKTAPTTVNLATAILDIDTTDVMRGSSTIVIKIADPDGELTDSGFFDVDKDGRPDPIDVNYPRGTKYWWRLTQIGLNYAGHGITADLTFMERAAVWIMAYTGPAKASRASKTRAEFLKWCTDHVKRGGGLRFHSKELHKKQPIKGDPKTKSDADKKASKDPGLHTDEKLKIKGDDATRAQLRQVERALQTASSIADVPELAVIAMLCAGIGESAFKAVMNAAGSKYGGVFQGNVGDGVFAVDDTEDMAESFLRGGKGFQGGGAIALANAHPDMDPGDIATKVEASGEAGSFYGKYKDEAQALLEAAGGSSFGGTTYRKQFNFEIGTTEDPHEDFWTGMQALADVVNWPLFLDGNDVYFDPETSLIRQKVAAIIRRGDPAVVSFKSNWDGRHIATEAELVLICDPFEFRAGEVFKLSDFGPASTGSTVGLPGRWLIDEGRRKPHELTTTFQLKQAENPDREPAAEKAERADPAAAGGDVEGTPKEVIDNVVLPIARECGISITALQVEQANARHGPTVDGGRSDHQGPPKEAWAADMSNGSAPTPEMDRLAKELAKKFDIKWNGSGLVSKTSGKYRFQLIYRTNEGGDHYNHVHFGVKRIAPYNDRQNPASRYHDSGPANQ